MSDPYGRTYSPPEPPRSKFFSITRPFRYAAWAWLWLIGNQFYWGYKKLTYENDVLVIFFGFNLGF